MSDELALFGSTEPENLYVEPQALQAADWQIELLRKALDARGLVAMADRQRAVETAAGRPVPSLRDLTHDEALRVITRLGAAPRASSGASAWDERGDDTWIDRL